MNNYRENLEKELRIIKKLLEKNEKNLKGLEDTTIKSIHVNKIKNGFQYFFKDGAKYKYIKKSEMEPVKNIIQKKYELSLNKKLIELSSSLEKFLAVYDFNLINEEYEKCAAGRKVLIEPIYMPNEEYIQQWLADNKGGKNMDFEAGIYETINGEFVRSKTEKILADMFYQKGIPYQYEPELRVGEKTIYPDFILLNKRTRKTIYWEHLGLISDEGYASKNYYKLALYEENGYLLGKDVLLSQEGPGMPLNLRLVETKIEKFLN